MIKRKITEIEKLKDEKLRFEISPHTFKNLLQQIQAHALATNKAIEYLMQMLNYMLYEIKDVDEITLNKEIEFLQNYRKLQQALVPGFIDIEFDHDESLDYEFCESTKIAPLITVGPIENAFKHADFTSKSCKIQIKISKLKNNTFVYKVANTIKYDEIGQKVASGIGSRNIRERLKLIYESNFNYEEKIVKGMFVATLKIKLNKHEN